MMSTDVDEIKNATEELLNKIILSDDIPDILKGKLFRKLEESIVLNMMNKLLDQLPEKKKESLESQELKTVEDVFKFFGDNVPREQFIAILGQSVETILKKFLERNEIPT